MDSIRGFFNTTNMNFLEKDLEQIIWESDNNELYERGLMIQGKKYRQLRIGEYGIADLVTVERGRKLDFYGEKITERGLIISIYELKKERIGISAFFQAIGYAKGIKYFLDKNKPSINYEIQIYLVGNNVDTTGSFIFLPDLINKDSDEYSFTRILTNVRYFTYSYKLDGMYFTEESEYHLTNSGF